MSPSQMKDLMSLADTGSVSKNPSTTVTEVVSVINPVIPRDSKPPRIVGDFTQRQTSKGLLPMQG